MLVCLLLLVVSREADDRWLGLGGPTTLSPDELRDAFIHFSAPIIRTCTTQSSASPVCATLYHDLQLVPFVESGEAKMHVGPPAVGVEVELRGDDVEVLDVGGDPRGTVGLNRGVETFALY